MQWIGLSFARSIWSEDRHKLETEIDALRVQTDAKSTQARTALEKQLAELLTARPARPDFLPTSFDELYCSHITIDGSVDTSGKQPGTVFHKHSPMSKS